MKKLIIILVISAMLFGVSNAVYAGFDEDNRYALFNEFWKVAGLPEDTAWYWADYLFQEAVANTEMRNRWANTTKPFRAYRKPQNEGVY
jgi:hypothetical protein